VVLPSEALRVQKEGRKKRRKRSLYAKARVRATLETAWLLGYDQQNFKSKLHGRHRGYCEKRKKR